jgi:hypothetical protein
MVQVGDKYYRHRKIFEGDEPHEVVEVYEHRFDNPDGQVRTHLKLKATGLYSYEHILWLPSPEYFVEPKEC